MGKDIILSMEDQTIAEQYLAKLERRAKNSKRNRWILLCLSIFSFTYGSHILIESYLYVMDDYSVVDRLKSTEIPNGVLPDYWFVGETRKTAAILEQRYKMHLMNMFDGFLGVIFIALSTWGSSFLLHHWNDGVREALLSKILRAKWNEILSSQDVNKPSIENNNPK